MATISEALTAAIQHHQAGRLQAAEEIYRQILAAEPNQADAWHLLGVINAQTGNHQLAVEYIYRALTVKPDWAEAQANLGNALREQGKLDEAVSFLQRLATETGLCLGTQQSWPRFQESGEAE